LDISKKKTAGRKKVWTLVSLLSCKYPIKLLISEDKKKYLNALQELKIFLSDCKSSYDELPTAKTLHRPIEPDDELTFCKIIADFLDNFLFDKFSFCFYLCIFFLYSDYWEGPQGK